jgi:hypothetical protein
MDVIEHAGTFWLVPEWLENRVEKWRMPARIVSLDGLKHQRTTGSPFGDFVVNEPLSEAVLSGRAQPTKGSRYRVLENPGGQFPLVQKH